MLLEWTAKNPEVAKYDGGPPREMFRIAKPFQNHNGSIALNPEVSYPIVEYDHTDPLFQRQVAVTGGFAYRDTAIRQLTSKLIFGDNLSGELFYVDADNLPK